MSIHSRLPDAEFDIMQIIWSHPTPISSIQVATLSAPEKNWKPQTVLTLLTRLTNRGFLSSEKQGKERLYMPIISKEEYLNRETNIFMQRFHQNSLTGMMNALYAEKNLKEEDIEALETWLHERK
jgi:predicted transcriptional regulator